MPAPETLPPRQARRDEAELAVRAARMLLIQAAKRLDGNATTAHRNAVTAIVALDDTVDAIEAANDLDSQFAAMEVQMAAEGQADADLRRRCDERGIAPPGF